MSTAEKRTPAEKFPIELVPVKDSPTGTILVRRFDTLGIIMRATSGKAKGWGAMRLQQDLGFHTTKANAIAAVERADKAALPGERLTQRQLRRVRRAETAEARRSK